jgi:hypothetical protein
VASGAVLVLCGLTCASNRRRQCEQLRLQSGATLEESLRTLLEGKCAVWTRRMAVGTWGLALSYQKTEMEESPGRPAWQRQGLKIR